MKSKYFGDVLTTKWQYNQTKTHAPDTIQTKLPAFYHQNQHITPQNNFAKKSLNKQWAVYGRKYGKVQKCIYVFLDLFIFYDEWGECLTARRSEAYSSWGHSGANNLWRNCIYHDIIGVFNENDNWRYMSKYKKRDGGLW